MRAGVADSELWREVDMPALVYSYLRFSGQHQKKGDSARRQNEALTRFLEEVGGVLDEELRLRDDGVSAFRGAHREDPDRHDLARFLERVKQGRVPRGAYLAI